ncbi:uncharacterized protein LOC110667803 [Hevea brasiliensis]|uniref:uncharacterized protein LOC110667803 n=1 Tax=Hevea brasiliensis TaxID=3981 RepID=UPI0025F42685|nr:uncharacterized protein LOC110667803 [Hevea brasiliensis]
MGFRDFDKFNTACLAKQSWHLLVNPTGVWARILKGLYFPHTSFWQARKSQKASWIWQSLLESRRVLKEGFHSNIRDGSKTLIWKDPWVPSFPNFRVHQPPHCPTNINLVSDLIDHRRLIWKTTNGRYTVRSGYRVLVKETIASQNSIPRTFSSTPIQVWKGIWKLDIQPKVKNFIWKSMHNAISVRMNLRRHGMRTNPMCLVCNTEEETLEHTLFWCDHARATWFLRPCSYKLNPIGFSSIREWWTKLFQEVLIGHLSPELLKYAAITCWQIWKDRNNMVFNSIVPNPLSTLKRILLDIQELEMEGKLSTSCGAGPSQNSTPMNWSNPERGVIKFNCDVAWSISSPLSSVAVIARNFSGRVVDGVVKKFRCSSLLIGEAFAVLKAIWLAYAMGCSNIILESDSLILIKALENQCSHSSPWEIRVVV